VLVHVTDLEVLEESPAPAILDSQSTVAILTLYLMRCPLAARHLVYQLEKGGPRLLS
jgi:hypothetical protein